MARNPNPSAQGGVRPAYPRRSAGGFLHARKMDSGRPAQHCPTCKAHPNASQRRVRRPQKERDQCRQVWAWAEEGGREGREAQSGPRDASRGGRGAGMGGRSGRGAGRWQERERGCRSGTEAIGGAGGAPGWMQWVTDGAQGLVGWQRSTKWTQEESQEAVAGKWDTASGAGLAESTAAGARASERCADLFGAGDDGVLDYDGAEHRGSGGLGDRRRRADDCSIGGRNGEAGVAAMARCADTWMIETFLSVEQR